MDNNFLGNEFEFVMGIQTRVIKDISRNWEGLQLEDVDFRGDDLSGLSLTNCTFKNCTFTNADLELMSLEKVSFENCDLSDASFKNTRGEEVGLDACKVDGLDLSESYYVDLYMLDCEGSIDFSDGLYYDSKIHSSELRLSNFCGADFSHSVFNMVELGGSTTNEKTDLQGAVFEDCDITDMGFMYAKNFDPGEQLNGCVVLPMAAFGLGGQSTQVIKISEPGRHNTTKEKKGGVDLGIYGNSYKAYLYCSHPEEIRKIGR